MPITFESIWIVNSAMIYKSHVSLYANGELNTTSEYIKICKLIRINREKMPFFFCILFRSAIHSLRSYVIKWLRVWCGLFHTWLIDLKMMIINVFVHTLSFGGAGCRHDYNQLSVVRLSFHCIWSKVSMAFVKTCDISLTKRFDGEWSWESFRT